MENTSAYVAALDEETLFMHSDQGAHLKASLLGNILLYQCRGVPSRFLSSLAATVIVAILHDKQPFWLIRRPTADPVWYRGIDRL